MSKREGQGGGGDTGGGGGAITLYAIAKVPRAPHLKLSQRTARWNRKRGCYQHQQEMEQRGNQGGGGGTGGREEGVALSISRKRVCCLPYLPLAQCTLIFFISIK